MQPAQERASLAHILTANEEVVVYGRAFMTITFDEYTKKVTDLNMQCEFTSFTSAK
jgi:hypothetical protein